MVYDFIRNYSVGVALDGKVWKHDGNKWSLLVTKTTLPLRYETGIAFDGLRVLVYGGQGTNGALGDFWAFDGIDWKQLSSAGGPGLRRGHAMAYDLSRKRLVLHGGTDMKSNFPGDTWEWDGKNWSQRTTSGPSSRVWHSMVYDPLRRRMVLHGGAMNPIFFYDTWEWDGKSWTLTLPSGSPGRALGGLVYDTVTQRVLAIAGQLKSGGIAGVDAYDPTSKSWSSVVKDLGVGHVLGASFDSRRGRTVIVEDNVFRSTRGHYFYDGGPGTYTPIGGGCLGGNGQVPRLEAARGSWPNRGTTFTVEVKNPGKAKTVLIATGLSNTSWGSVPLPLQLVGMPGCQLRISPDIVLALPVDAKSGKATLSVTIPIGVQTGLSYYQQALTLDPTAPNALGAVSNSTRGVVR
jgi:hypothetical protein